MLYLLFDKFTQESSTFTKALQSVKTALTLNAYSNTRRTKQPIFLGGIQE